MSVFGMKILLLVAVSSSLLYEASAKKNPCFKCSNWDATGQGFVESGENCITYLECWKDLGSNRIRKPLARFCPIGSMVINEDAVNGAPCGKCDVTVCPECMRDYSTIEIILTCPYRQMSPVWDFGLPKGKKKITKIGSCGPGGYFDDNDGICTCTGVGHLECPYIQLSNKNEFGMINDLGEVVTVGNCGNGGYFNDTEGICTCTVVGPGCTNRIKIPLSKDLNDDSCHKNWVGQTGYPTMVTLAKKGPPDGAGGSGIFTGYDPVLNNGPHLTTYALDGAFAGDWVFKLSFNAWFKMDNVILPYETQGVVAMGDCVGGSSAYISVVNGTLVAGVELLTIKNYQITKYLLQGPPVDTGVWHFVSVYYDHELEKDNLKLFVLDQIAHKACALNILNCVPTHTLDAKGSVTPRSCGFTIGSTAGSLDPNEMGFFVGNIARVILNLDPSIT